jgi:hypothetical protein
MWTLTLQIVMYALLLSFTVYIWYIEHRDIHCPSLNSDRKTCDEEGGMAFSGTQPSKNDTCQQLVNKIKRAGTAEQRSVKWRLALLMSVSIMLVMWLLVGTPGTLPDWKTFYLSVFISFGILLGMFIYYSYHIYGTASNWFKQSIRLLQNKGCINNN